MLDYPKYASGDLNIQAYSDMHYFDIKVPGEHTLNGETFDAEIQMFQSSLVMPRMSSLGIPVRADDGFDNLSYQTVLNEFKIVYDLDALACAQKRLRRRMSLRGTRTNDVNNDEIDDEDEENIDEEYISAAIHNITEARKLQWTLSNFDPFNDDFMTTMFFYRYDGSITEPPCRDITWWVMNQPMRISHGQLAETKRLLFSHVDANCVPTSVHNSDQSVARPIYPLGEDREIQHCEEGSFRSDVSKGRPPARECRT
jgi:Eukaryotic-type carbonic anhydrase